MTDLEPIYPCVAALDVHQAQLTVCIIMQADDQLEAQVHIRQFKAFKRHRRDMAKWIASFDPQMVVMESTGVYWKSPYVALEQEGIQAKVVNARHVKQIPGRKTDIADAQWLAILARAGLLSGSFIPTAHFRELRLIARQHQSLTRSLTAEKNRLHKLLTDAGIRLSVVVSDIHGQSARRMVKALIEGESPKEVLRHASKRLKASRAELLDAVDGEMTDCHRQVLSQQMQHIEELEQHLSDCKQWLLDGLADQQDVLKRLHTIPGIDEMGAAMLMVEIGDDMSAFGSAERLSSWVGVCPGNCESAGKRFSGKTRKGNPYVRRILCEAAQAASRTRCSIAERFKGLTLRRGHKRAIFATAHKLLKIIYVLIERGDYYRDANINYDELMVKRNAPRWIKKLTEYGYLNHA